MSSLLWLLFCAPASAGKIKSDASIAENIVGNGRMEIYLLKTNTLAEWMSRKNGVPPPKAETQHSSTTLDMDGAVF
jgi:hypothetical protein